MNATQHYNLNEYFKLSSVNQLTAFDADEYSWIGRTLTSWTDDEGILHLLDENVKFNRGNAKLSANWKLNRYNVNAAVTKDYGPGSGKVIVTTSCNEMPLPSPVVQTVQLSNNENSQIIYNSLLSVQLHPDQGYKATKLVINDVDAEPSALWIYEDASTENKTGSKSFNIQAGFVFDLDTNGIKIYPAAGVEVENNPQVVSYSALSGQITYSDGLSKVKTPFNAWSGYANFNSISKVEDPYGIISSIGSYSFQNCSNLSCIECSGVTLIGETSFNGSMISVADFPKCKTIGNNAFYNCKGLLSAKFDELTSLSFINSAFSNCKSLVLVQMPKINGISQYCFSSCSSLVSAYFANLSRLYQTKSCFDQCDNLIFMHVSNDTWHSVENGYGIPHQLIVNDDETSVIYGVNGIENALNDSVQDIADYAFSNHAIIKSAKFQNLSGKIGKRAFQQCEQLSDVCIPHAKGICENAFYGCNNLSSINISSALFIDNYAFYECKKLEYVNAEQVLSIGNFNRPGVFENCTSLSSINCPNAIYIAGGGINYPGSFSNCGITSISLPKLSTIQGQVFSNCSNLSTVNIPNAINIQYQAFNSCKSLTSVNFPSLSSLTNNDSYIFSNCEKLEYADFPMLTSIIPPYTFFNCTSLKSAKCRNIKYIDDHGFFKCNSLSNVDYPEVLSIGRYAFNACSSLSDVAFPNANSIDWYAFYDCSELTSIDFAEVSSIGYFAFQNCKKIVHANFPKLEIAGNGAFYGCESIQSLSLPKLAKASQKLFYGMSSLAEISIPMVLEVDQQSFYNCSSLSSISMPNAISVGYAAFQGCSSLVSADINQVIELGPCAFTDCYSLSAISCNNISSLGGNSIFCNCSSLTSIQLPNVINAGYTTSTYDNCMFQNCNKLKYINIEKLSSFGNNDDRTRQNAKYMFKDCSSLVSIDLPNVLYVSNSDGMFENCSSLTSVSMSNLSSVVVNDPGSLFKNCINLSVVNLPKLSSLGSGMFYNCISLTSIDHLPLTSLNYGQVFFNCSALTSVNLPHVSGMVGIAADYYGAFSNCSSLTSVSFENATSLGSEVFINCINLKHVNIPNVLSIYSHTFQNCSSLASIELSNVLFMQNQVFSGCINLSSIVLSANRNVPNINQYSFKEINHVISVYIPEGMSADYMNDSSWAYLYNNQRIDFVESHLEDVNLDSAFIKIQKNLVNGQKLDWTYTGDQICPSVSLMDQNDSQIPSSCYDLVYYDNVNAGTATVVAIAKSNSGYVGLKTGTFTILPANIEDSEAEIDQP